MKRQNKDTKVKTVASQSNLPETWVSDTIHRQMDEAQRLLNLKTDVGRLPDSYRKSQMVGLIQSWFEGTSEVIQNNQDTVPISWSVLQILWQRPELKDLLVAGLHRAIIIRLGSEDPNSSDDEDQPF